MQGRFTSPDEFTGGPRELFILGSGHSEKQALPYADIFSPQSLNKYQYSLNNPLRYVDSDGHDYRIAEEKNKDGKLVKRYVWDRNYTYKDGDKMGAPSNARYIDTNGRAIQLWGESTKDPSKELDHGYSVVEPGEEGDMGESYISQQGEAPTSFVTVKDTEKALESAGYERIRFDPFHPSTEQYAQPTSPTLHVILHGETQTVEHANENLTTYTQIYVVRGTEFHRDAHTQTGSWCDLGEHLKDATKQKLGMEP